MSPHTYEEENHESLEGKLLVASPHLNDPYFNRSLVYICAHDTAGAIGIIVNQKIGMVSYADLLFANERTAQRSLSKKKIPLMFGGPVNTDMLVALSLKKSDKKIAINHKLVVHTDILDFFKNLSKKPSKAPAKFILAKGVTAWDTQQLEEELSENTWFVVNPSTDLIFSQKRGDKWGSVIKELGITNFRELVHYSGRG